MYKILRMGLTYNYVTEQSTIKGKNSTVSDMSPA